MTIIPLLDKPGRNRPVLLVESDSEALEALRLRVKADGFQVEVVHTASEATKKVLRTPYSAVLVGTDLPDGPGFAVAAELRRVDMRTPILLLAGPGSRDAVFFFQNGETPTSGVTDGDLDLISERILGLLDGEEPRPSVLVRCPPLEMNRVRREVRCSGV
jgi:CheY-like chemotaxis protein